MRRLGGDAKRKSEATNKPTDLLFLHPEVGPYVMCRPLGDDEEKLTNYCRDEKLNKVHNSYMVKLIKYYLFTSMQLECVLSLVAIVPETYF